MSRVVTILCSGMGLGVYVPSLLLEYQLRNRGIKTEVFIIENYFSEEKIKKLEENKNAFHKSFKVAVLGHRMSIGDISLSLEETKIKKLLNYFRENERKDFIVISGHWPFILERYINMVGKENINIETLRLDSDIAPSWKKFKNENNFFNDVWIFDNERKDLPFRISVNVNLPIPYNKRENRFLIHGGGWGMGTYKDKISELNKKGLDLDIVAYESDETEKNQEQNRYYLLDPEWRPWNTNGSVKNQFPPMFTLNDEGKKEKLYSEGYQAIYDVCAKNKAIISKPGGGSLVDSLASATPIIFLEPIAKHEQTNAEFWEELGLGISYNKWKNEGYSLDILEKIHRNLLRKLDSTTDYIDYFTNRYL